jgi:biotin-[acetyl-CoA-carboxylase] ligase BirA-like protein
MESKEILPGYSEYPVKKQFFPGVIYYTSSTASTMDDARSIASRGADHGTIVCTGFQSRGRGRFRDRKWQSSPGENLLFTLLLKKESFSFPAARLPILTGLALALFCEDTFGFSPSIKWPNDMLYNRKKFAGILWEGDNEHLYCGIGINCSQTGFTREIKDTAISLSRITGKKIEPMDILEPVLASLWKVLFTPWDKQETWHREVTKRLYRLGDTIRVIKRAKTGAAHGYTGIEQDDIRNTEGGKNNLIAKGVLAGIDHDGALLVLETGKTKLMRVISGEVVFGGEYP